MDLYNVFSESVEKMIEVAKNNKPSKTSMPYAEYMIEFKSVWVYTPRGIGKTKFIKKHITENDALITFLPEHHRSIFSTILKDDDLFKENRKPKLIIHANNINQLHHYFKSLKFIPETIYIDEPDVIPTHILKDILLRIFDPQKNQIVVALGAKYVALDGDGLTVWK